MVKYFLPVTLEIISLDMLKVLQVLHLLSLQREIVKPVADVSPRATMNDVCKGCPVFKVFLNAWEKYVQTN